MIELASIIILGIFAQWLAWRFKVPAILPLILVGLAVGPFAPFWTGQEGKWLDPIYNSDHGLFPGQNLFYFVELAIGIILFEGGLTLQRSEIKTIGPIILKLISLGSAVTFFGGAVIAHFLIGLSWPLSFLFSGLIIVTGPTVISPILRNVPLKRDVANILKWEGILIDPIGALVAVLVYEFISSLGAHGDPSFTEEALKHFLTLTFVGLSMGGLAAFALKEIIKRLWVPHYLLNVFTLAFVLMVFVGSGYLVPDSGLLTIVVMGMVLTNIDVPNIEDILYFKESLSLLLISMLFILLAANINMSDLELLLNWRCATLFLLVILVLRPLGVFLSAHNSTLSQKEKLFIGWLGPRGIVAAGIASLFGSKLVQQGFAGAEYITPLVFMIVLGTVLLNATTARLVARLLGVMVEQSHGMLIIGANKASRFLATYIYDKGQNVILVDSNKANVDKANNEGLKAYMTNIYTDDLKDNVELNEMGYLLAMTGSPEVNRYSIEKFGKQFGENGAYRFVSSDEKIQGKAPSNGLFSSSDDFINFSEVARDYPEIHELSINNSQDLVEYLSKLRSTERSIPVLILHADERKQLITAAMESEEIAEGSVLAYMGKELVAEG